MKINKTKSKVMSKNSDDGGYKETEIGNIPTEWEVAQIGDKYYFTKKPNGLRFDEYDTIPFVPMDKVPIGKLRFHDFILKKPNDFSSGTYFEAGDLLLSKITPSFENGKQGIIPELLNGFGVATTEVIPIKEIPKVSNIQFLAFLLLQENIRSSLAGKMEGSTGRQRLSRSVVEQLHIPFPPLPEQRMIAVILSKIQQAIEVQEKIIERTMELKKSLLAKLFSEGLHGEELKETEIGLMPKSWEVQRLVDIATLQRGKDLPAQNWVKGSFPIVGSNGIIGYHNEYFLDSAGVITGRSGSIGKLSYVEGKYWAHNTALYVKDFHGNHPKFVYYLLHRLDFRKYVTGVSVPTLNRNFIHPTLLPLPSVREQNEIAAVLDSVERKIRNTELMRDKVKSLFKSMLHQLMTGQIRVNNIEIKLREEENR